MLVPMSMTTDTVTPTGGFCFHCGTAVDGDIMDHVSEHHRTATTKPKTTIKSWQSRLDDISNAITEVRQESDLNVQIQKLDKEVIEELYLVRAKLTQTKRNTAQSKKG